MSSDKSSQERKISLSLSSELYEELREFCDKIKIPFMDFIEESLESATQRYELEILLNDKAKVDEKIKSKQQAAFLEGFAKGVLVSLLSAEGRLALSRQLTPRAVKELPRYRVTSGEQLSLFKE